MIKFLDYQKSYGSNPVLDIERLNLTSGIYWLRGENGSGKSTLLKSIAGIIPFKGNIILNDTYDIKRQAISYRKLVNFSEAEPIFPEFLSGRDLIKLFSTAKNAPKGQHQELVEEMEMGSYLHPPIGNYSSGMIKKLSLLLSFLGHPKLILLDEPLITLDAPSQLALNKWVNQSHRKHGVDFILSSHQTPDNIQLTKSLQISSQAVTIHDI
mgnify:CR=1 FL=1